MLLHCTQGHENPPDSRFCGHCGQPLPLAAGQIIQNRYRIVKHLGQGGFGSTFLAEDLESANRNSCVLKVLSPQSQLLEHWQKAKELFQREAQILCQLQHPQIPAFRELLPTTIGGQEYLFLVQDYVQGETYYQLLVTRQRQGLTFSETEIRQLLAQILPVLSYIHSCNVIHRDISPDNLILRSYDHQPVLIDFGGVKQLSASSWWLSQKIFATRIGKKGYAPEEQLHLGQVYPNSDLYALAVTALVLLTGKEPSELYDNQKGIWLWGREINLSPQLEAVLKQMLAYKPKDRYQSAQEVLQALKLEQGSQCGLGVSPSGATGSVYPSALTYLQQNIVQFGSNISQIRTVNLIPSQLKNRFSWQQVSSVQKQNLQPWIGRIVGVSVAGLLVGVSTCVLMQFLHLIPGPKIASSDSEKILTSEVLRRRQALGIKPGFFNALVDEQFYAKYPELKGRSLDQTAKDANFRYEWDEIAQELLAAIEQAKLSNASRHKLGSYGQQDYVIWQEKASHGQLAGYTMEQLVKQINQEFIQLFPQQQDAKFNQQTFGQIWYALFFDRVNQLETTQRPRSNSDTQLLYID